jgi:hypothetical protein
MGVITASSVPRRTGLSILRMSSTVVYSSRQVKVRRLLARQLVVQNAHHRCSGATMEAQYLLFDARSERQPVEYAMHTHHMSVSQHIPRAEALMQS